MRSLLVSALLLVAVPAQDLQPRNFYFDDFTDVLRFDLKALREQGIWDDLQTGGRMVFGLMEQQAGFPLSRLDRFSVFFQTVGAGDERRQREVFVLEGNAELTLTPNRWAGEWRELEIGGYTVQVGGWNDDNMRVLVRPELRVSGYADLIRPVLEGKRRAGLPSADVMSFVAGRKTVLGYLVVDMRQPSLLNEDFWSAFGEVTWPERDRPTHVCFRLEAVGEEDDPHVQIELIVRHGTSGEGLAVTEQAVADRLAELRERKETRLFRPWLKRIEHERQGTDAVYRLDLGRARSVAGLLGMLMPFMVYAERSVPKVEAVEIVEEAEEAGEEATPEAGGGN